MGRHLRFLTAFALVTLLAAAGLAAASTDGDRGVVARVADGDTLTLRDGRRIRLVQIDAPELGTGECYSRAARTALLARTPIGSRVTLEADPALDRIDRFGRLLRYVRRGSVNVNVELVRAGAAARYVYDGDRGRYASRLVAAAQAAKFAHRGLWKACPATPLDPERAVATGRSGPPAGGGAGAVGSSCDPNYADGCVPPYPPDVDCADIRALDIAPVRVVGADPHRLDGDGDGWGCE
jgi:endonuclease YncB( thermonuclease family)